MKLVISFIFFLLLSFSSQACELKKEFDYISLSGPVTMMLKEFGLIKQLRYISSFHPFEEKVKKVSGGIFLNPKELSLKSNTVLFFDKSEDFEKTLKKVKVLRERVSTLGMSSIEASLYSIKVLRPYLNNCEQEILKVKSFLKETEALLKKKKISKTVIFYLGFFQQKRNNGLVMANDLFVKDLKTLSGLKTYPAESAYVNWSAKIVSSIQNKLLVGIKDGEEKIQKQNGIINVSYPGSLIPGISQLKFLRFLLMNRIF